jgi:hypothetical protein
LTISIIVHLVGIWFLAPIVFQARVRIANAQETLAEYEHTIVYTPLLPQVESSSKPTWNNRPSTEGTLQSSAEESIRAMPIDSETTPVLVTPAEIKVNQDASELASTLTLGREKFVQLAPQPIEITSGQPREIEAPPSPVDVSRIRTRAPVVSATAVNVKLGRQPVEIASDRPRQEQPQPVLIPVSSMPAARPSLPVTAAPKLQVVGVPAITGGASTAKLIGAPAGPAPSLRGGISGSSSGSTSPDLAVGMPGPAVVLNPSGGSRLGSSEAHPGRIAASADIVASGRGLGMTGGGPSDGGHRGTSPGEHDNGATGPGSRGTGEQPSAGTVGTGPASPVAIESSVVNLGSFGPSADVHGPVHGQRAAIVVVSSAAAGGALEQFAKTLKGQVYTIYLNAAGMPAVMQFAEHRSSQGVAFSSDLVAPETVSTTIPDNVRVGRQVVSCVLTKEGTLDRIQFLLAATADQTERLLEALKQWRFRPAYREDAPIEVDVVIGFGIGTN